MVKSPCSIAYNMSKIQCPRHYLISPTFDVYVRDPVSWARNVSKYLIESGRATNTRVRRDKFGEKIIDWRKVREEEKKGTGKVIQPWETKSFFIEHVWDPKNPMCVLGCKQKCRKGKGHIAELSIKRLNGHFAS